MKNYSILVILISFVISCSVKSNTSLNQVELVPKHKTELPIDAKSGAIVGIENGFASFQKNASTIDIWTVDFDKKYSLGREGRGPGEIGKVAGIYSSSGSLFILDTMNKAILQFDSSGTYINSTFYEDMVMAITPDSQNNIYSVIVNFDRVSIRKSVFEAFSDFETVYSFPIRDLSESAVKLYIQGNYLLINRYLTNKTLVLDLSKRQVTTLINEFLPENAEFSQNGPYKLPIRPVWRSNLMINNSIFQLRNISANKSEVYRSDLDGNIDVLFTFNHYTTSFFENGNEVWMFSPDSLFKYNTSSFTN